MSGLPIKPGVTDAAGRLATTIIVQYANDTDTGCRLVWISRVPWNFVAGVDIYRVFPTFVYIRTETALRKY